MARLCVLICRIDDEQAPDRLTELQRIELPAPSGAPTATLDHLETQAVTSGQEVMRSLLSHQWQLLDEHLTAEARRLSPPRKRHR
jgi:hypothetical protein